MSDRMKPCPFCNETDLFIWTEFGQDEIDRYQVCCANIDCCAEGPLDLGESGAVEKWNTRAGEKQEAQGG